MIADRASVLRLSSGLRERARYLRVALGEGSTGCQAQTLASPVLLPAHAGTKPVHMIET